MEINGGRQEQADFNGETGPAWSWYFLLSEDQIASLPQPERDLHLGLALKARTFPNIKVYACQCRLHKLGGTHKTQNSGIIVTEDSVDKFGRISDLQSGPVGKCMCWQRCTAQLQAWDMKRHEYMRAPQPPRSCIQIMSVDKSSFAWPPTIRAASQRHRCCRNFVFPHQGLKQPQ